MKIFRLPQPPREEKPLIDPLRNRPYGEPEPEPGPPSLRVDVETGLAYGPGVVPGLVKLETPEARAERVAKLAKEQREANERRLKRERGF